MENASHTLAGMALAEVALRLRSRRSSSLDDRAERALARAAYAVSIVTNNLSDIDVVFTSVVGGTLNYLLHHRGHTHTLAAVPALALATLAVPWLMAHRGGAGMSWGNREWRLLGLLALLGPCVHILLDFANSYGVHPFWPVENGWFYGDTIFIVEPLFWLSLAPPLFFAVGARWGKALLGLIALLGVVLIWVSGLVPVRVAVPVTIFGAASALAAARSTPGRRIGAACAAFLGIVAMFAWSGRAAKSAAARELAAAYPGWASVDLVTSPAPSNPFCWSLIAVQRKDARYALRRATLALAPGFLPAAACPSRLGAGVHPPMGEPRAASGPTVVWSGEAEREFATLADLAATHCEAKAFFQFARAPFVLMKPAGPYLVDLRFDRTEGVDLAELQIAPKAATCPPYPAPWRAPVDGL